MSVAQIDHITLSPDEIDALVERLGNASTEYGQVREAVAIVAQLGRSVDAVTRAAARRVFLDVGRLALTVGGRQNRLTRQLAALGYFRCERCGTVEHNGIIDLSLDDHFCRGCRKELGL